MLLKAENSVCLPTIAVFKIYDDLTEDFNLNLGIRIGDYYIKHLYGDFEVTYNTEKSPSACTLKKGWIYLDREMTKWAYMMFNRRILFNIR